MKKRLLITVMAIALALTFAMPAMATETTHYALTSNNGTVYVYDYQKLSQSFMNYYLQIPGTELYTDYAQSGNLTALKRSVKGWVDYADIKNAYQNAVLFGQPFSLDTYVQNQAIPANMPQTVTEVTVENGQIVRTEKQLAGQLPAIKNFEVAPSLEMGKKMVMVELDTDEPEKYEVYVKEVELTFHASAGKFVGDVPENDALQANVIISPVGQDGEGDFKVSDIY